MRTFLAALVVPCLLLAGCTGGGPAGADDGGTGGNGGNGNSSGGSGSGKECGGSGPTLSVGDFWDFRTTITGSYSSTSNSHDEVTSTSGDVTIAGTVTTSGTTVETTKVLCAKGLATKSVESSGSVSGYAFTSKTTFDPPCNGLRFPVTQGDSYTQTCSATVTGTGGSSYTQTTKVTVGGTESITVPAGTFQATKITYEIEQSGSGGKSTQTGWYVPSTCALAKVVTVQSGATTTVELTNFRCANA